MYHCVICHFEVELDDAIAPTSAGACVCLRCFARETGSTRSMPKHLARELTEALSAVTSMF